MTYLSTNSTMPAWTSAVIKWLLFRLGVYVAFAAICGGLFFAGVAVYVHFVPPKPIVDTSPPDIPFPKPIKQFIQPLAPSPNETDDLVASFSKGKNLTLSELLKQKIYDQNGTAIALIHDAVVDPEGKISVILSVATPKEKDIAIPFDALMVSRKNGTPYVMMNDDFYKNAWSKAPDVRYDGAIGKWLLAPKPQ